MFDKLKALVAKKLNHHTAQLQALNEVSKQIDGLKKEVEKIKDDPEMLATVKLVVKQMESLLQRQFPTPAPAPAPAPAPVENRAQWLATEWVKHCDVPGTPIPEIWARTMWNNHIRKQAL